MGQSPEEFGGPHRGTPRNSFIYRCLLRLCVEIGLEGLGDVRRPVGKPWQ